MRALLISFLAASAAALAGLTPARAEEAAPGHPDETPPIETAFRRMYELRFDEARAGIRAYQSSRPDDPFGVAAEAASHLFEEFDHHGVLTSGFFLDDDRFLGGIAGKPDPKRRAAFLAANQRARDMAGKRLKSNPDDPDALFALTMADGMQGDFEAVIEKSQLSALGSIRRAEAEARRLLAVRADAQDAYVALGAANYIIGSLPSYKRFFLWFGGVRGDRLRGMEQLQTAADRGHYLAPLAKAFLALAAEREGQFARASTLFDELAREFPENPLFAREASLAKQRTGSTPAR
jgi:tetratricopeptide (TPR) repeat protein